MFVFRMKLPKATSWVVLGSLRLVGILVHMHGTELQTIEGITVQTRSCLLEEDRTRTLNLDDERDDRDERQYAKTDKSAHHDVESSLHDAVGNASQRLLMVGIYRSAHEVLGIEMQLIFAETRGKK